MNTFNNSNKRASQRINRSASHASFTEGAYDDIKYTKKRSLSDGCIDLRTQKTTLTADSSTSSIPSTTALSNAEHESISKFTPKENTKNDIRGITRLTNGENAPIPVAFLQEASPHDVANKKKSKHDDKEVHIDIPEYIEESKDAPLPSPLYEFGERLEDLIASDNIKKKINGNRHEHEQDSLTGKSERISNVTNVSMCSSSKDRLSAKSSNTELAVARPVNETDTIYEAHHYEPTSKQPIYKSRKCYGYTFLVLAVVIVLVTVTVYYATKPFVPCCEYNETLVHTMRPTTQREATIRQMIEDNVLKRNATFNEMKAIDPRYLALDWIVNEDRLQLTVNDSNLMQRYILAVLAFSFDLISWDCGMVKDLDSCNITDDYGDYALWLSRTDECLWYGVECECGVVTGLDLSSNNLIGKIPPEISGLRSLKLLALQDNCIHGTLPHEMFKLNLTDIDLSWLYLEGTVPNELYGLKSLTQLNLDRNRGGGDCNRTDQEPISVTSKGLTGNILGPGIGKLNRLKELTFESNNFSGTISSEIGRLRNLIILGAHDNHFSGTIPGSITKLQNLRELSIGRNEIEGSLPSMIGRMASLTFLDASDLNMSGTIPDSLYSLRKLKLISLQNNGFHGSISTEIGRLVHLEQLILKNNPLISGTLPSELGLCEDLIQLGISLTNITGTSPEVCSLRDKKLNFQTTGWAVVDHFESDCRSEDESAPFFNCTCCTGCCDHKTQVCVNKMLDGMDGG